MEIEMLGYTKPEVDPKLGSSKPKVQRVLDLLPYICSSKFGGEPPGLPLLHPLEFTFAQKSQFLPYIQEFGSHGRCSYAPFNYGNLKVFLRKHSLMETKKCGTAQIQAPIPLQENRVVFEKSFSVGNRKNRLFSKIQKLVPIFLCSRIFKL